MSFSSHFYLGRLKADAESGRTLPSWVRCFGTRTRLDDVTDKSLGAGYHPSCGERLVDVVVRTYASPRSEDVAQLAYAKGSTTTNLYVFRRCSIEAARRLTLDGIPEDVFGRVYKIRPLQEVPWNWKCNALRM